MNPFTAILRVRYHSVSPVIFLENCQIKTRPPSPATPVTRDPSHAQPPSFARAPHHDLPRMNSPLNLLTGPVPGTTLKFKIGTVPGPGQLGQIVKGMQMSDSLYGDPKLGDHKRHRMKLLAPFGAKNRDEKIFLSMWHRSRLPEILWIAELNHFLGARVSLEILETICRSLQSFNGRNSVNLYHPEFASFWHSYAPTESKKFVLESLAKANLLGEAILGLKVLFGLYPEYRLFLIKTLSLYHIQMKLEILKIDYLSCPIVFLTLQSNFMHIFFTLRSIPESFNSQKT